jgi:hypothetical protein
LLVAQAWAPSEEDKIRMLVRQLFPLSTSIIVNAHSNNSNRRKEGSKTLLL